MPHVMDKAKQLQSAAELTFYYGKEIDDAGLGTLAQAELMPTFEQAVDIAKLNEFNEKCRKWIDNKLMTP